MEVKEHLTVKDAIQQSGIPSKQGSANPALKQQRGKSHTGPLATAAFTAMLHGLEALEGGYSNDKFIDAIIYRAEQDALVGVIDGLALGEFYSIYSNMVEASRFIVIRSIVAKRKLAAIPAKTDFKSLLSVLYPPTDPKWSEVWRQDGKVSVIERRASKCKLDYEKREAAKKAAAQAEKDAIAFEQLLKDETAKIEAKVASGELTREAADVEIKALVNPAKAEPMPDPVNSVRGAFIVMYKLASDRPSVDGANVIQSQRDFVIAAFTAMGYGKQSTVWIADINADKNIPKFTAFSTIAPTVDIQTHSA